MSLEVGTDNMWNQLPNLPLHSRLNCRNYPYACVDCRAQMCVPHYFNMIIYLFFIFFYTSRLSANITGNQVQRVWQTRTDFIGLKARMGNIFVTDEFVVQNEATWQAKERGKIVISKKTAWQFRKLTFSSHLYKPWTHWL